MNGQVLLDLPVNLSDGTRVTLLRYEAYEDPHPLVPYDREKEIGQIRAAIARNPHLHKALTSDCAKTPHHIKISLYNFI